MAALVCALMTLLAWPAAAQVQPQPRRIAMTLVPETTSPVAGGRVTLAFDARPASGWHAYWQNPGDAGMPATAAWTLPAGVKAGELRYPVPERLLIAGLMNYVYERPFALLVDLDVPAGLAAGTRLPISVKLDYLVCTTEICVPESQTLATVLTVGDGEIAAATRARFDAWRQALPKPLGATATWQATGGTFRLAVPYPSDAPGEDAYFYPAAAGAVDYAAPQRATRDGDQLVIETKAAATPATGAIAGVLAIDGQGFGITARPGVVAAASRESAANDAKTFAWALLGALVGGLLLNVMPCVFPILSLKALSLAKSGADAATARREALAYTAGVVSVCLALGGLLLVLRAGGAAAGWAFQLQDPRVIALLLLLTVVIALNLAGLFELPTPRVASRAGASGAFATGALAAFVATPCTGPFMGAALGAALVLPTAAALAVFAGLGFGIALPFLAIGFVPALRRRLPKPGLWMVTFRHILALPMFATALALAWVLGRQAGVDGLTLVLGAAIIAGCGLWWAGRRQAAGRGAWVAAPALAAALFAAVLVQPAPPEARAAAAGGERFTEARLAALQAEGRPVFAYFTADWCLTCKVNEKAAIETDTTAAAFRRGDVAVLVGDWTDGDPVLGRFIQRHNRAGVPLYLWYRKGMREPQVLPQLLTPAMLADLSKGA